MFKEADVLEVSYPKLTRVACAWFDFELNTSTKSTLLQAFPQMLAHLPSEAGKVQNRETPKGKEAVLAELVLLFVQTLPLEQQTRLSEGVDLPKHYLQPELQTFLKTVAAACDRAAYRSNFRT